MAFDHSNLDEAFIEAEIEQGRQILTEEQWKFFESIRVDIQKWQLPGRAEFTNGFWVVGTVNNIVLWYNPIEDGFNNSTFETKGIIGEYLCDQDEFDLAIRRLKELIEKGIDYPKSGPPQK